MAVDFAEVRKRFKVRQIGETQGVQEILTIVDTEPKQKEVDFNEIRRKFGVQPTMPQPTQQRFIGADIPLDKLDLTKVATPPPIDRMLAQQRFLRQEEQFEKGIGEPKQPSLRDYALEDVPKPGEIPIGRTEGFAAGVLSELPFIGANIRAEEAGEVGLERIREETPTIQLGTVGGEPTFPREYLAGTGVEQLYDTPRQEAQVSPFDIGRVTGRVGGTIGSYVLFGPYVAKLPALSKITNPLAKELVTEGLKDLVISGTTRTGERLVAGMPIQEALKEVPKELLLDSVINAAFFGGAKLFRNLRTAGNVAQVEAVLKNIEAPPTILKNTILGDGNIATPEVLAQVNARRVAADLKPLDINAIRAQQELLKGQPMTELGQDVRRAVAETTDLTLPGVARPATEEVPTAVRAADQPLQVQRGDVVSLAEAAQPPRVSPIDEGLPQEVPQQFRRAEAPAEAIQPPTEAITPPRGAVAPDTDLTLPGAVREATQDGLLTSTEIRSLNNTAQTRKWSNEEVKAIADYFTGLSPRQAEAQLKQLLDPEVIKADNITALTAKLDMVNQAQKNLDRLKDGSGKHRFNLQLFADSSNNLNKALKAARAGEAKAILATAANPKESQALGRILDANFTGEQLTDYIKQHPKTYFPTSNEARRAVSAEIVATQPEGAFQMLLDGDTFKSDLEPFIGRQLMEKFQLEGRVDAAVDVYDALYKKAQRQGRGLQALHELSGYQPNGFIRSFDRKYKKYNNVRGLKKGDKGFAEITNEDKKRIIETFDTIRLADESERSAVIASLNEEFMARMPKNWAERLAIYQTFAHLINPGTIARNIIGNTVSVVQRQAASVPAAATDSIISAFTGAERTTGRLFYGKKHFKAGIDRAAEAARLISQGKFVRHGRFAEAIQSTDKGLVLWLQKMLGYTLQVPDEFFKGLVEAGEVTSMLGARNIRLTEVDGVFKLVGRGTEGMDEAAKRQLLSEVQEQGRRAAETATFQNDSTLANVFSKTKKILNKATSKITKSEQAGLGDFVIKYTTVPGNIITRAYEVSPLGAVKVLNMLNVIRKDGLSPQLQREFSLAVGDMVTGTGAWYAAMKLYDLDILTFTDANKPSRERAKLRSEGKTGIQINVTAVKRLLTGQDYTPQAGDERMNLKLFAPMDVSMAMGAVARDLTTGKKPPGEALKTMIDTSLMTVEDMHTLSLIKSATYKYLGEKRGLISALGHAIYEQGLTGAVPSVVRQIARANDPIVREAKTLPDKIKATIPGLRETLTPVFDVAGRPREAVGGIRGFFTPAYLVEDRPIKYSKELDKIQELTGDIMHLPVSRFPKYITVDKVRYDMNREQFEDYVAFRSKHLEKSHDRLIKGKNIDNLSPSQLKRLAENLSKANTRAGNAAKEYIFKKYKGELAVNEN